MFFEQNYMTLYVVRNGVNCVVDINFGETFVLFFFIIIFTLHGYAAAKM